MPKYNSSEHLKSMQSLSTSKLFNVQGKVVVVTGGSSALQVSSPCSMRVVVVGTRSFPELTPQPTAQEGLA